MLFARCHVELVETLQRVFNKNCYLLSPPPFAVGFVAWPYKSKCGFTCGPRAAEWRALAAGEQYLPRFQTQRSRVIGRQRVTVSDCSISATTVTLTPEGASDNNFRYHYEWRRIALTLRKFDEHHVEGFAVIRKRWNLKFRLRVRKSPGLNCTFRQFHAPMLCRITLRLITTLPDLKLI
jgi:hypothetical protein